MGHFSHNCKLTGLPITGGTPVALIVMQMSNALYENSEDSLRKFGTTYMCSNDGTRLKFKPIWLPIKGDYDDYGGITNIIEDDNTKMLEKYYDLSIYEIMAVVTSGRKDDGYDDALKVIKEDVTYPEDWIEGENHFKYYQRTQNDPMPFGNGIYPDCSGKDGGFTIVRDGERIEASKEQYDADFKLIHEQYARYQEWSKNNPDPEDDYKNAKYKDRYKELITYSGMWVHGEVYDKIANSKSNSYRFSSDMDLGSPELLEYLGFKYDGKSKDPRYNKKFTKDDFTVYTDGTWIRGNVYSLKDFKKLCKENGTNINIKEIKKWTGTEQLLALVVPKMDVPMSRIDKMADVKAKLAKIKSSGMSQEEENEIMRETLRAMTFNQPTHQTYQVLHKLLNTATYGMDNIENPFTVEYFKLVKEGKLVKDFGAYWKFDNKMYAMGRYYEPVGTGPQDGEHSDVLEVLKIAQEILEPIVREYEEEWED